MSVHKALLITGATGKQGGATIEAILASPGASNFTLLALTRNANSPSAVSLARKSTNIKIIQGDLDDSPAIFNAASKVSPQPVWGVLGVTTPAGGGEERQGKALVDAAIASGVRQFVFTSVDRGGEKSASTPTNIPHFITKYNIEKHLQSSASQAGGKMSWTILRPPAFMENFTPDMAGKLFPTAWKQYLGSTNKSLQLISSADIGVFAAQAFLKPEEYHNQELTIIGDDITYEEANRIFKEKVGKDIPLTFNALVSFGLWAIKDLGLMFQWFREGGFGGNLEESRKRYPGVMGFGEWLEKKSGWIKR